MKEFQAHEDYLLRCVVSPDANSVATASSDKTVKVCIHTYMYAAALTEEPALDVEHEYVGGDENAGVAPEVDLGCRLQR